MAGDPTRVIGRRIIGYLLDSVIDVLVLFGLLALLDVGAEPLLAGGVVRPGEDVGVDSFVTALGLYGIYYVLTRVLMLGMLGWTPGMVLMGIRCVRWDGGPCGLLRALARTLVAGVLFYLGGTLYGILCALIASTSKGHRTPQDMVASTYVIDAMYKGRMILDDDKRVVAGPQAVTREELAREMRKQGVSEEFVPPNLKVKPGEPTFDKKLDTYVMWDERHSSWMRFDKASGAWERIG